MSFRTRLEKLERQVQIRQSERVSIWEVICGLGSVEDLNESDRAIFQQMGAGQRPDPVHERIVALLNSADRSPSA
jgi:hypothetical protein